MSNRLEPKYARSTPCVRSTRNTGCCSVLVRLKLRLAADDLLNPRWSAEGWRALILLAVATSADDDGPPFTLDLAPLHTITTPDTRKHSRALQV